MSQTPAPSLLLVFLLMIPGVYGVYGWGVSYSSSHICALKNSSVIMRCSYTYPTGHQIRRVFWTKTQVKNKTEEFPDLSNDTEYSQRLQYLGDQQQNCTIRLSHVTLKDEHEYYFRFTTNKNQWIGAPGVSLSVTDLQVESPERVTEGDSVHLTCKSSCKLTDGATFIWYRNSQQVTTGIIENQLDLGRVRREDEGIYSCGVNGQRYISPAVEINVMLHGGLGWRVWLGITVACVGFFIIIIIIILFIMRKRRGAKAEDLTMNQDNRNSTGRDGHVSESDDAQCASVTSSKPRRDGNAPDRRDTEEIQYATVQHHKNQQKKRSEENERHYDNIRIHQPESAVRRSNVETVGEDSVIYSRVK